MYVAADLMEAWSLAGGPHWWLTGPFAAVSTMRGCITSTSGIVVIERSCSSTRPSAWGSGAVLDSAVCCSAVQRMRQAKDSQREAKLHRIEMRLSDWALPIPDGQTHRFANRPNHTQPTD